MKPRKVFKSISRGSLSFVSFYRKVCTMVWWWCARAQGAFSFQGLHQWRANDCQNCDLWVRWSTHQRFQNTNNIGVRSSPHRWRLFFGYFLGLNFLCEFLKKVLSLIIRILRNYLLDSHMAIQLHLLYKTHLVWLFGCQWYGRKTLF